MDISRFFDDLGFLARVDWKIMKETYWADTIEDGDRSRRRQAEFLVHQFFPLNLFESIGVIHKTIASQVSGLLQPLKQKPNVVIAPAWYY